MRYIFVMLFIFLITVLSTPLLAQEDTVGQIGLGISIDPTGKSELIYIYRGLNYIQTVPIVNLSAIVFYVPINVTNSFRIEPSIGVFSTSSTNSTSSSTTTDASSVIILGLRGTYRTVLSNSLDLYFGPRLEFCFLSSKNDYSYVSSYPSPGTISGSKTTTTETDVTVGAVVGVEYFPIRKFSVGGEINFNYVTFGNPDYSQVDYPPPASPTVNTNKLDQYTLYTGALFFLRWYIF
jgi:hypothetical protein